MRPDNEQLERLVNDAVRSTSQRAAPATLERRVMKAIEQRTAAPWWRKDFARWPAFVRVGFLIAGAGLAYLAFSAPLWLWESSRDALPAELTFVQMMAQVVRVVIDRLPSVFVYSALAALAMLYGTLFGVGAIAYRSLFGRPRSGEASS